MQTYSNLGDVLRKLREAVNLTQSDIALQCGVHSQFVSNWERGLCNPPQHCLKLLAKALKLSNLDRNNIRSAIEVDLASGIQARFKGLL